MLRNILLILAISFALAGCAPVDDEGDDGSPILNTQLSVEAQPWSIRADGASRMVIFVEFREQGTPVPDSTQIILLNSIGTLSAGILYTRAGIALDTLTSDTVAALGYIVAYSNGMRDSVEIAFAE